ncbi:putative L-ribulokinase [Oscillibacter valericigenes Sjm18-20]|nr:putative L-ribulokinase [Oscillibacter valericigenes Sjm18-20]
MKESEIREAIVSGKTVLGIELGSTKIKAVLIASSFSPVASGSHDWKSTYENGNWTYSLEEVWSGLRDCYRNLAEDVLRQYGVPLITVGCMGFSAMMHGYLPFDRAGKLLAPFRTWQNTSTAQAAAELSELFQFNIPQRWSIAHLEQAILNGEEHVARLSYLTTLAGYVHWQLTGQKVLGIGDASGMFPIDSEANDYDARMLAQYVRRNAPRGYDWTLREILPKVLLAGDNAGCLTKAGAGLLDPTGNLRPGIPVCPPEGDAGTGMAATNSVAKRTGNVSAGTSVFSMVVLEKAPGVCHPEIDMVTTPAGAPVAMVHCNNCTNDMNAWVELLGEFTAALGAPAGADVLYPLLYSKALEGEPDCGGVLICNYLAGEPITGVETGRPLLLRSADSRFTFANFCRASLFSTLATLKVGMDILAEEHVALDRLTGHGGLFRQAGVGAKLLAAATNTPVQTMKTAAVGGPYGMALLASYAADRCTGERLEDYLQNRVFRDAEVHTTQPEADDVAAFNAYLRRFKACLAVEKAAAAV